MFSQTLVILCFVFSTAKVGAATGFIDLNYYGDTRDFNVLTINALGKINEQFEYFSLTNYYNGIDTEDNLEKTNFFTEQNIRYKISNKGLFDIATQFVMQSAADNDLQRLGLKTHITNFDGVKDWAAGFFWYSVTFYLLQFDSISGFNWQMEHVYRLNILQDNIFLTGFLDHNFLKTGDKIVSEHQIAWKFFDEFHLVGEYRINEFLTTKKTGFGYGLEYKIIF